jgi:alginate O-acetyltransferase complex protein AlgI
LSIVLTFLFTTLAWVFFRADTLGDAIDFLRRIPSPTLFQAPAQAEPHLMVLIALLVLVEWLQRRRPHGLDLAHLRPWIRRVGYAAVFLCIFFFGHFAKAEFIYFQF